MIRVSKVNKIKMTLDKAKIERYCEKIKIAKSIKVITRMKIYPNQSVILINKSK